MKTASQVEYEELLVPESLLALRYNQRATILFWWLIATWGRNDDEWAAIHDDHFKKIATNNDVRADVRRFLEHNSYIDIKKTVAKNGEFKHLRIKGKQSQCYRVVSRNEGFATYIIESERLKKVLPYSTQYEPASLLTRRNLDLLERKPEKKPLLAEKKRAILKDWHSIRTLEWRKGNVHRGRMVNRLYSPWANASKRVRPCFSLAGEDIVCLDLRASQVALLAAKFDDQELVRDCAEDRFYEGLASILGTTRDDAKEPFYEYYFGENRTEKARNKRALEVQKWMMGKYPKTGKKVFEAKSKDHRQLAIDLQNREASIFIDGAYLEFAEIAIPALTVHDALYVAESTAKRAKRVIEKHLAKVDGLTTYYLKQEIATN